METTKIPDKLEERFENWTMMMNMVKKDFEGRLGDWGLFASLGAGYSIAEGTGYCSAFIEVPSVFQVQSVPCSLSGTGNGTCKEAITGLKCAMVIQEFKIILFLMLMSADRAFHKEIDTHSVDGKTALVKWRY